MKEYKVKVIVSYSDTITVRANNDEEAKNKAREVVAAEDYDSDYLENFEAETYEIVSSKEIDEIKIKLEQTYLFTNDATIIWEYTYKGEEIVRERIVGYYHGEPTVENMKKYAFRGVEGVLDLDDIYE